MMPSPESFLLDLGGSRVPGAGSPLPFEPVVVPRRAVVPQSASMRRRERASPDMLSVEVIAMTTREQRRALGEFGEEVAAGHLRRAGMVILDRNFRCAHGEIDIVARDGNTLVICEVKTRRTLTHGSPFEAVTPQKAARLRRLAAYWLAHYGMCPPSVRIDVVGVVVPRRGAPQIECVTGVA